MTRATNLSLNRYSNGSHLPALDVNHLAYARSNSHPCECVHEFDNEKVIGPAEVLLWRAHWSENDMLNDIYNDMSGESKPIAFTTINR